MGPLVSGQSWTPCWEGASVKRIVLFVWKLSGVAQMEVQGTWKSKRWSRVGEHCAKCFAPPKRLSGVPCLEDPRKSALQVHKLHRLSWIPVGKVHVYKCIASLTNLRLEWSPCLANASVIHLALSWPPVKGCNSDCTKVTSRSHNVNQNVTQGQWQWTQNGSLFLTKLQNRWWKHI